MISFKLTIASAKARSRALATELTDLSSSHSAIGLLHYGAVVSTVKIETVADVTLRPNLRSTRRNAAPCCHPDLAGTVVDFVSADSHRSVTVGNIARSEERSV